MKGIGVMSVVTGLVELWLAGQAMSASRVQFSRVMKGVASILFLVIVSSILGLMVMGCIYTLAYMTMVADGLAPVASLLILLAVTAIALAVSASMVCARWKHLSALSERMVNDHTSSVPNAGKKVLNAFLDGFKAQKTNFGAP